MARDKQGTRIKELLIDRVRAGVKVRFLYDAVGSWHIGREYVEELRAAGVEVRAFMPVAFAWFRSGLNHRDHRKIVVVDGGVGFLGGLNIGDRYRGEDPRLGRWRDTHLRLEGPAVHELDRVFLELWMQCIDGKKAVCKVQEPQSQSQGNPSPEREGVPELLPLVLLIIFYVLNRGSQVFCDGRVFLCCPVCPYLWMCRLYRASSHRPLL